MSSRSRKRKGTSKYWGVYKCIRKGDARFQAAISYNKTKVNLGFFIYEEDAAVAYDEMAKILHKPEYRTLNFE